MENPHRGETISFIFPPPKIPSGKRKGHLATMNNVQYWLRYNRTAIKNELIETLESWHIAESTEPPYKYGQISYRIHRDSKRKIDADAFGFTNKWVQDLFVRKGYLVDDDQVVVILLPAIINSERAIAETMIEVIASFADEPFA